MARGYGRSDSDEQSRAARSIVSGKTLVPIETAIALAIAVIAVPATFFATKASLESRIKSLETARDRHVALQEELDRAIFVKQRNQLRLLANEVRLIQSSANKWSKPTIEWGPGFGPGEAVKAITKAPRAISMGALASVVYDPHFQATGDSTLIGKVNELFQAVDHYNAVLQSVTGPVPPPSQYGSIQPKIEVGMMRRAVEPAIPELETSIEAVAKVASTYNFDTAISAEVSRIDALMGRDVSK